MYGIQDCYELMRKRIEGVDRNDPRQIEREIILMYALDGAMIAFERLHQAEDDLRRAKESFRNLVKFMDGLEPSPDNASPHDNE